MKTEDLLRAAIDAKCPFRARAVSEILIDSARKGERRPAYVKLEVADGDVQSLRGPASKAKTRLYLVQLPAAAVAELERRSESRIVLPGGVVR